MTDACFLARGAQPLKKPTTCEECFAVSNCKMYENYRKFHDFFKKLMELAMEDDTGREMEKSTRT